jgi:UDP-N-acetylmuramate dehydrogenase
MTAVQLRPAIEHLATRLRANLGPAAVQTDQALARYTSLRIGGPADLLAVAGSGEALRASVTAAWEEGVPCRVMGSGSNVLVSDSGLRGLVVLNRARAEKLAGAQAWAESGTSFSTLARRCVANGLGGLEWAVSIPGTVGGALVGNAGAWGGDVATTLVEATVLETDGQARSWPVERFEYGYRRSTLKGQGTAGEKQAIVLGARFALHHQDRAELEARVAEITARRKASQPAGATCGSVFKNPPDDYAGRLIEAAGLKGVRRGGAEISTLHANFIVNRGGATAADVGGLIALARQVVQERFGLWLELEIELFGEWQADEPWLVATHQREQASAQQQGTAGSGSPASTQGLVS